MVVTLSRGPIPPSSTVPVAVNFLFPKYSPNPHRGGTLPLPISTLTEQGWEFSTFMDTQFPSPVSTASDIIPLTVWREPTLQSAANPVAAPKMTETVQVVAKLNFLRMVLVRRCSRVRYPGLESRSRLRGAAKDCLASTQAGSTRSDACVDRQLERTNDVMTKLCSIEPSSSLAGYPEGACTGRRVAAEPPGRFALLDMFTPKLTLNGVVLDLSV